MRLAPLGEFAVRWGADVAGVPLELIIGNFHRHGVRAPFDPRRVVVALRWLIDGNRGVAGFVEQLGEPSSATGSSVVIDVEALASDGACDMTVRGRVAALADGVRVFALPNDSGNHYSGMLLQLKYLVEDRLELSPAEEILIDGLLIEESTCDDLGLTLRYRRPPADLAEVERALATVDGYVRTGPVELPPRALDLAQNGLSDMFRDDLERAVDDLAGLLGSA